MNTDEALEKVKAEQRRMLEASLKLEKRTEKLQQIAQAQDPQGEGFKWYVDDVRYSLDRNNVARVRLKCENSGAVMDFREINHQLEIASDNGFGLITLKNYIDGDTRPTKDCQHIDYSDTMTGAVCNDCGEEIGDDDE